MKPVLSVGVVLLSLFAVDAAAQPATQAIFSAVDAMVADRAVSRLTANPKGVADRRVVGMRLDRLFDSSANRVLLNVEAHQWVAQFERLDTNIRGYRTWVGSIEGVEHSLVSFTERGGIVSGLVNAMSEIYAVQTIQPGVYTLDRVIDISAGELEPRIPPQSTGARAAAAGVDTANDDPRFIDVLMLYTPGARAVLGYTLEARVEQIISDSNTIFGRSGITTRLRLVGSAEAALPETTNMSADLDALTNNPLVSSRRTAFGADLVQLLQDSPSTSACGIGWVLTNLLDPPSTFPGYSIADISPGCVYTSTHEMGHNMGSQHDPGNASFQGAFPYSYGYQDTGGPSPFRTVMAYPCGSVSCPRITNFSNPNVTNAANGRVTGTSTQDNALSINNTASTVANFRQSTTTVAVPGPPTGLTSQVNGLNVTLSWHAVTADPNWAASAAMGYTLEVGSEPGDYSLLSLPVGNTTTISGSAPAATYYWRVFGTNSAGNGTRSAPAQFTLGGCTPPGAPQTFTHSLGANRIVTLNWAPASGTAPLAYTVDVGSESGLTDLLSAPVGGVTGLSVQAPPGRYYVRIRAANACAATSPGSNERVIVVP